MNIDIKSLDLNPMQLKIVQSILRKIIPNYKVFAFGSRTKGTAHQFSDLDLVIYTKESLGLKIHAELTEAFSESDLPFKVDIVDWATIKEPFRRIIEENKILIQN